GTEERRPREVPASTCWGSGGGGGGGSPSRPADPPPAAAPTLHPPPPNPHLEGNDPMSRSAAARPGPPPDLTVFVAKHRRLPRLGDTPAPSVPRRALSSFHPLRRACPKMSQSPPPARPPGSAGKARARSTPPGPKPLGLVLYRGPSLLNGQPIVCIATGLAR